MIADVNKAPVTSLAAPKTPGSTNSLSPFSIGVTFDRHSEWVSQFLEKKPAVVTLEYDKPWCFPLNPFADMKSLSHLNAVMSRLEVMCGDDGFCDFQNAGLRQNITELYAGIKVGEITIDSLSEFIEMAGDRRVMDIKTLLFDYTKEGVYNNLFNNPGQSYDAEFVNSSTLFDCSAVAGDTRMINLIYNEIKSRLKVFLAKNSLDSDLVTIVGDAL